MGAFSITRWLIVLLVVLLLFGPKKISEVGKGLGQGLRNFRTGLSEDEPAPRSPPGAAPDGKEPPAERAEQSGTATEDTGAN